MSKKSTIMEIAASAGVSRAAAYAVLSSGKPNNIGVSQEKREKILAAASSLGYVKNELARSLVTGRSSTIAFSVQSLRNHFFGSFFSCFDDLAYKENYSVIFSTSEYDTAREARNIRSFAAQRVAAIIIAGPELDAQYKALRAFLDAGGHVIVLGDNTFEGFYNVAFDEPAGGRMQAEYLYKNGHRKVAHLNGGMAKDTSAQMAAMRYGYFDNAWKTLTSKNAMNLKVENHYYIESSMADEIASKVRRGEITAIACSSDTLAMGLISSLTMKGIRVPEDISIIGMDDLDYSSNFFTPLTTVRLPTDKLALETWKLFKKLEASEAVAEQLKFVESDLIIRKSTAPAR